MPPENRSADGTYKRAAWTLFRQEIEDAFEGLRLADGAAALVGVAKGRDPELIEHAGVERRAGVLVAGRWLPESELISRLEALAESYRE